jgi:4-carboxymuconolactone decarboxylase
MPEKSIRSVSKSLKRPTPVAREFARLAVALTKHDTADGETRRARGLRKMTAIVGVEGGEVMNRLVEFSPELARFIVDFGYGDVISRDQLDDRTRALVVVAALAALGNAQPQLQVHIGSALNSGCTREEIMEVLLVVSVYAGFPAALNGVAAARAVLAKNAAVAGNTKASRKNRR